MDVRRARGRERLRRRPQLQTSSAAVLASIFAVSIQPASGQATTAPSATTAAESDTSFMLSDPSSTASASDAPSTTTPFFSRPTSDDNAPDTSIPNDDDGSDQQHSTVVNYYFAFIAIFFIVVFAAGYLVQKRRRAQKEAYLASGQHALARDLEGWTSTRRWRNGHWRSDSGPHTEEGLNELGQAPPPYAAKSHSRESSAEVGTTVEEPQIPLRTLARDERDRSIAKPPEYSEAVRTDSFASAASRSEERPGATSSRSAGPEASTSRNGNSNAP